MSENKKPNRLINEKSPYLLQHAYNPVDWYPWGEEAFSVAATKDLPILLSIGYSTCHWCHVMERESFEDDEVAELINEKYVAIKVDREERPDIDHIYMEVCQTLTGQGGWPLTVFMTAEKKPFYAGTYFPKKDRMGLSGIITIMDSISYYWNNKRKELLESSEKILEVIKQGEDREVGHEIDEELLHIAFEQYRRGFDNIFGGFNKAPKFPTPHNLYFLLRYWKLTDNETALAMVRKTLDSMYRGGIYDHVGFGFSRYSTDEKWLVPHFEKMLYDNALLAIGYLETYQAIKNNDYSKAAEEIFTYVLRDMTSEKGGFYSAEDADSEGVEGKFYLFSYKEVVKVLGEEAGNKYSHYFDITEPGNFEKSNILNLIKNTIPTEDRKFVENCRQKLFDYRKKRIHPHKDDKILTGWNSMMIVALSIGGRVLNNSSYTKAAERSMKFILDELVREDNRLLARYREGEAAYPAYAEDYAYTIWALIELYETTFSTQYLSKALTFTEDLIKLFWDENQGGFFLYGSDGEGLLTRPKDIYDGAVPSGNSVMSYNLLRLARITGRTEYEERAMNILNLFGKEIEKYPMAYAFSLISFSFLEAKTMEVVILNSPQQNNIEAIKEAINSKFNPYINVLYIDENDNEIKSLVPFVENYKGIDHKTTIYICQGHSCLEPTTDLEMLKRIL